MCKAYFSSTQGFQHVLMGDASHKTVLPKLYDIDVQGIFFINTRLPTCVDWDSLLQILSN
jgi:hypothetical protein